MKNSQGVNDFAERNIRLIQDFIHSYKAEDMKQSVLRVATDNSSKISSHSLKEELTLAWILCKIYFFLFLRKIIEKSD